MQNVGLDPSKKAIYEAKEKGRGVPHYGANVWTPLSDIHNMLKYISLVMPLWKSDIDQKEEAIRYVAALDIDMNFAEALKAGELFTDEEPGECGETLEDIKKHFLKRFKKEEGSIKVLRKVCPIFDKVIKTTFNIKNILDENGVKNITYWSGGKGFHIYIYDSKKLWYKTLPQRGGYQDFLADEVIKYFDNLGLTLTKEEIDITLYKNALKTDAKVHPTSKLWPTLLKPNILAKEEDVELTSQLSEFWKWANTIVLTKLSDINTLPNPQSTQEKNPSKFSKSKNKLSKEEKEVKEDLLKDWIEKTYAIKVKYRHPLNSCISYTLESNYCPYKGRDHTCLQGRILVGPKYATRSCHDWECSVDSKKTGFEWPKLLLPEELQTLEPNIDIILNGDDNDKAKDLAERLRGQLYYCGKKIGWVYWEPKTMLWVVTDDIDILSSLLADKLEEIFEPIIEFQEEKVKQDDEKKEADKRRMELANIKGSDQKVTEETKEPETPKEPEKRRPGRPKKNPVDPTALKKEELTPEASYLQFLVDKKSYLKLKTNTDMFIRMMKRQLLDGTIFGRLDSKRDFYPISGKRVINLRTKEIRPRVYEDLFTNEVDVDLVDWRKNKEFKKYIFSLFPIAENLDYLLTCPGKKKCEGECIEKHKKIIANTIKRKNSSNSHEHTYMKEWTGLSLTGETEKLFWVLIGDKDSGKSTFNQFNAKIHGDKYGTTLSPECILKTGQRKAGAPTPHLIPLIGLRWGTFNEFEMEDKFSDGNLRSFTGNDGTSLRDCFAGQGCIRNIYVKMNAMCNPGMVPKFNGVTKAVTDRFVFVHFSRVFPANQLYVKLLEDKDFINAFFSWAVEGAVSYYRRRHLPRLPSTYKSQKRTVISEQDTIKLFLSTIEARVGNEALNCMAGELFSTYDQFCKDNNSDKLPIIRFRSELLKMGYKQDEDRQGMHWIGIQLKSDEE